MAVPRLAGGMSLMLTPPKMMSPDDTASCPAIMRNVEVLPQPDGPSRQQYVPASMWSVTLFTASVALNRLQRATSSSAAPRMLWLTPACCARRATSSTLNCNAEVHKLGKSAGPLPVVWASLAPLRGLLSGWRGEMPDADRSCIRRWRTSAERRSHSLATRRLSDEGRLNVSSREAQTK